MAALMIAWLMWNQPRKRWLAMLPLIISVALGAGAALVALGAAERTANAYGHYLDRADVGDVLANPSLMTTASDRLIRGLPGVQAATRDVLFVATIDEGAPRTRAALDTETLQTRGSIDGRYVDMDRPAFVSGRAPTGPNEAIVNQDLADARGVHVGDVLPVAFWSSFDDAFAELGDVLAPVGVEHVQVVGIAVLADEVLPDGLFSRQRLIVSPDVAGRHDCLPEPPSAGTTYEEAQRLLAPRACSTSYPFYSLLLSGGAAGVETAQRAFAEAAVELNAALPEEVVSHGASYSLIITTSASERARVDRSIQPTVTTLLTLAVGTAVIALVVMGLTLSRELRRAERDQRQWWQLGMRRRDRLGMLVALPVIATAIGLVVAVGVAWIVSPVAPLGTVRSVQSSPARQLSGRSALAALGFFVVALIVILALAWRVVQHTEVTGHRNVRPGRTLLPRYSRPEVDVGIRAAINRQRGAGLVVASGSVAAAVLVVAVVFGASLSHLLSTPASYGWPWDAALMGGYGYGSQDVDAAEAALQQDESITSWTGLGFGVFTIDGAPVVGMVDIGPPSSMHISLVSGRLPATASEVAIGTGTARDGHVGIGDQVDLGGTGLVADTARVTGIVVLPALGPFQADRAAPGTGLLLPAAMVDKERAAAWTTFFGFDLAKGTDQKSFLDGIHDEAVSWALEGDPVQEYARPVRPAEIINAQSMRVVPLAVAGLLAVAAVVGLLFMTMMSVRSRRRELGTLRALGFTGRQLRNSVRVQAITATIASLIIGIPAGLVVGRLAWSAFASGLGVLTGPTTPVLATVATIAGALVVSLVSAALPARSAASADVSALQAE